MLHTVCTISDFTDRLESFKKQTQVNPSHWKYQNIFVQIRKDIKYFKLKSILVRLAIAYY